LIRAVAELREEYSLDNFCVLIIGDGPERGNLQKLVEKLDLQNFIHFTGLVRNVEDYVWNLDAGVLCSDREGLSNAILEYMACGLPVVATSVGGNVELVNEANGICVPPGDCKALAEAMFRLIGDADLRIRLGESSLDKIQASFSWEKSMRELESYYSSLLVGKMGNG
jgi:glycosyltransferase involved in cell wall biosynthesis